MGCSCVEGEGGIAETRSVVAVAAYWVSSGGGGGVGGGGRERDISSNEIRAGQLADS